MKKITLGIFAHVDSGKTTLTEAMLFKSNAIRKLGRVDHKDSFLDTDSQERARGITIFSKMATLSMGDFQVTLLDTPGHSDFSQETERAMAVLDYAILIVDGKEGPTAHTETLLELLDRNEIPVFCFVNKMDMDGADRAVALEKLYALSGGRCVSADSPEDMAMTDERLMESFLDNGDLDYNDLGAAIRNRKLIPCFFGSALKLEGVDEFMEKMALLMIEPARSQEFSARVFKIENSKERLTYMKVLGGQLKVRQELGGEKVSQIRKYQGDKFVTLDEAGPGDVVAVLGLENTFAGQGLGECSDNFNAVLSPVFRYTVKVLSEDAFTAYGKLKSLEEEDPSLGLKWNEDKGTISANLMGPIQIQVLKNIVKDRFGMEIDFVRGDIIYKETISAAVEGVGHYEPLKHYAEVHLLLEPGKEGSGLSFGSLCSEDILDKNWQRLIMIHLLEKEHLGVLTASPITDMKISILTGKAHQKHTEGGDFRQATYRAVRNGLMKALVKGKAVLLEPWYEFELTVPAENIGRAMTDIQNMGGQTNGPELSGDKACLKGSCPAKTMAAYPQEVISYTKGAGSLRMKIAGYKPCADQDKVAEEIGYIPDRDVENSADSIFCQHGAGVNIKWDQVEEHMHLPLVYKAKSHDVDAQSQGKGTGHMADGPIKNQGHGSKEEQRELDRIFEKTYGSIEKPRRIEKRQILSKNDKSRGIDMRLKDEFLVVDGYNLIFAWPQLKELSQVNLDSARDALVEILSNYQGFRKCRLMVVFDSYKVKGAIEKVENHGDIQVAFTKEGETADTFIEKLTFGLDKEYSVRVATSDALEQNSIFAHGCVRVSSRELIEEIGQVEIEIKEIIEKNNRSNSRNRISMELFEK